MHIYHKLKTINYSKYRYPIALTSQFYFCGMPFRLDSYRGCPCNCIYCFVTSRNGNFKQRKQYANTTLMRKWFKLAFDQCVEPKNVIIECLQRRMPLHFGGVSDPILIPKPFRNITIDILKILDNYSYPTLISTKANIREHKDIADIILNKSHFALQVSFSTMNDDIGRLVEPNTPTPSQRIKGVKFASDSGTWVSCRLQPYFPRKNIDNMMDNILLSGFKHLTVEHFKLPFDGKVNVEKLKKAFSVDILEMFPKDLRIKRGREFEMPNYIRLNEIRKLKYAAISRGIPIGIGDNGFQHLSTTDCCCGIDALPDFKNWFKHTITEAVRRAKNNDNKILYESIRSEWAPKNSIASMINSKTRLNKSKNTVRNHIKFQWYNNKQFSPAMFYGVTFRGYGKKYQYILNDGWLWDLSI